METIPVQDNLNFTKDNNISKIINDEKIFYSGKIHKVNDFGVNQERNFIITSKAIYNLKKTISKRRFEIKSIKGITKSKEGDAFVIHGDLEYDYYYISTDKILIIIILAKLYEINCGQSLKISEINKANLKSFVTTKKNKTKDSNFSKMDESKIVDIHSFLTEEFEKYKDLFPIKENNLNNIEINYNSISDNPIQFTKIINKTIFSNHETIKEIKLDDFKIIKILGRGLNGKVLLVKYLNNNEYYVMKSLNKNNFLDKEKYIENKILKKLDFIFLIKILFCFETNNRIYFIMELYKYGELYSYLKLKNYFDENTAKFYISIIGITLDYLHKNNINNRNLKPESLLFDKDGYLKIMSFGLEKLINNEENNNLFSSEYLSPEIIQKKEISNSNDWWILGTFLYEMLVGIPPFYDKKNDLIESFILNKEVQYPNNVNISDTAKDLISKLLNKQSDKRLGSNNGFEEIKKHEFFKDINFDDLINKKINAPYKPILKITIPNDEKN
jgi:hypothetical protein